MCSVFWRRLFPLVASFFCIVLFLVYPQAAVQGFRQGIELCLSTLLPALFPFFVACNLALGSVPRKSGFVSALLLSWLGGYAVCAGMVRDLRRQGNLDEAHANLLLVLGCCSGPGFVIGSVGGHLLGSVRLGMVLYLAQLIANLASCLILLPFLRHEKTRQVMEPSASAVSAPNLSDAIVSAVNSCLCVCGSVLFFRVLEATLILGFSIPAEVSPYLSALCEISSGCADFSRLRGTQALYGICLCLSFLGASVFSQLASLLQGMASLRLLLIARLLHFPLLGLLVRLILPFLPGDTAVFSSLASRVVPMNRVSPDAAFLVFLFLCAVLYKIRKRFYNDTVSS